MKKYVIFTIAIFCTHLFFAETASYALPRSFSEAYPGLSADELAKVRSEEGLTRSGSGNAGLSFLPSGVSPGTETAITGIKPSFIVESVRLLPEKNVTLVQIYNALGRVRDLKGRTYHSATKDKNVPLFEDATRIESEKKHGAIADPPPASIVPPTQTIYAKLKDANFGNCYYELALSSGNNSIICKMTNFKTISYIVPVMKERKFVSVLYIEPVAEGLLVYSAAGAEVSNFVSKQINIPSALRKRLDVIINWMADGLTK